MIRNFFENNKIEYSESVSLKKYNTYRIDAKSKYIALPKNKEELRKIISFLKENNEKYLILGNGSNVILTFEYYDGVVILLKKLNELTIKEEYIEVGAGYSLPKLAIETANLGLEGLEFAAGIPGQVGASIAMNAGAYKNSLSEIVTSVLVMTPELEWIRMENKELDFSYRDSFFKKNKDYYIVSAQIKLKKGNKEEILEKINKRRIKRLETQPLDMPSAGSVFRNPEGMHAGELIEKCKFKGYSIKDAEVSTKHANFIINKGNAKGKEIVQLIEKIKESIKQEYKIDLILEQIIIK